MLCLDTQGQFPSASTKALYSVLKNQNPTAFVLPRSFQQDCFQPTHVSEPQAYHQWPWRILPFASDLGTVGYLLNRPKLGVVGWLIATPYYLYALWHQPDAKSKKEEMVYQSTANGVMPFLEAKLGVMAGEKLHSKMLKQADSELRRVTVINGVKRINPNQAAFKLLGGLLALITITPTIGDKLSGWICQQYQQCADKNI